MGVYVTSQLSAQSVLARDQNVLSASLDDELVLLSIEKNRYYGSGDVGRRIWDLCEDPCSVNALVEQLIEEYDVAPQRCLDEVMAFSSQMLDAGLLVVVQSDP